VRLGAREAFTEYARYRNDRARGLPTPPCCVESAAAAVIPQRTILFDAKDGVGQASGSGSSEWIVFRITDVTIPPVDMASDDVRKLKETLERGLTDEQLAQFVNKIESDIGTSINQAAFAQVTGASNN